MHYVLDARTAMPHFPGIGRYTTSLASAIPGCLQTHERVTILHHPEYRPRLPDSLAVQTLAVRASPFSLGQQTHLPRLLAELSADVYHSAYVSMPYRPGVPTVLTVYDLIPLRYPRQSSARARILVRWATRLALNAASSVIAISEATRQDFALEFPSQAGKVSTVPLAAGPAFQPQGGHDIASFRERLHLPPRYGLYLGSNKPHKNLPTLLSAWARLEPGAPPLVISGAWDQRYADVKKLATHLSTESSVIWLGPVSEADLPALYASADLFVFPSLCEGFGLPVLEAMACGTPVICSSTSSLPEVTGDAALLVDPKDAGAWAAAISSLMRDDGRRAVMREQGLARARLFSWEQTACKTLEVYRQVTRSSQA